MSVSIWFDEDTDQDAPAETPPPAAPPDCAGSPDLCPYCEVRPLAHEDAQTCWKFPCEWALRGWGTR